MVEKEKTDGASIDIVATELKTCCDAWDPKARLIGNIRAEDIGRLCSGTNEIIKILKTNFEYYRELSIKYENTPHEQKYIYKMQSLRDTLKDVEHICIK